MTLLAEMPRKLRTIMATIIPMLLYTIATIFLMSNSVAALSPVKAYPQIETTAIIAANR